MDITFINRLCCCFNNIDKLQLFLIKLGKKYIFVLFYSSSFISFVFLIFLYGHRLETSCCPIVMLNMQTSYYPIVFLLQSFFLWLDGINKREKDEKNKRGKIKSDSIYKDYECCFTLKMCIHYMCDVNRCLRMKEFVCCKRP